MNQQNSQQYAQQQQYPQQNNESAPGLSIASLVLGILSLIGGMFFIIPPILAIIFGHVSRGDCKRRGIKAGMGMALAGLILGYICLIPMPVGLMAAMAIPAFQKVREQARIKVVENNLRQISASADQYFLETGNETVTLDALVGKYISEEALTPIAGETYPTVIKMDDTQLFAEFPDGTVISIDRY